MSMELNQIEMFGCTIAQIREEFENWDFRNKKYYIMGIISDAQDTSFEDKRDQLLNKAKYVIDQLMNCTEKEQ